MALVAAAISVMATVQPILPLTLVAAAIDLPDELRVMKLDPFAIAAAPMMSKHEFAFSRHLIEWLRILEKMTIIIFEMDYFKASHDMRTFERFFVFQPEFSF